MILAKSCMVGLLSFLPVAQSALQVGTSIHTLRVLEEEVPWQDRSYVVHVPSQITELTTIPIMFVFHGSVRDGPWACENFGAIQYADELGFVAVCPSGYQGPYESGGHWNIGMGQKGDAGENDVPDVAFVEMLVQHVKDELIQMPLGNGQEIGNTYAVGFSNGAGFVWRLSCDLASEVFQGLGAFAGYGGTTNETPPELFPDYFNHCNNHNVPLWEGWGTNDEGYLAGSSERYLWNVYSANSGCSGNLDLAYSNADGVACVDQSACTLTKGPGTNRYCTYEGLGHMFPGGPLQWNYPAIPMMLEFFESRQPTPQPTTCADDDAKAIEDAALLGLTISGCVDMQSYCDDPGYGSTTRGNCPATCGLCQVVGCLVTDGMALSPAYPCACGSSTCSSNQLCTSASSQCDDCPDDDAAAIAVAAAYGYEIRGCIDLPDYCDDPTYGSTVRLHCSATCGLCQVVTPRRVASGEVVSPGGQPFTTGDALVSRAQSLRPVVLLISLAGALVPRRLPW